MFAAQDVLDVRPELARRCLWDSPATVLCTFTENDLHPATRYQVSVNPNLRALDGSYLGKAHRWGFESERPDIDLVLPTRFETGLLVGRSPIVLESTLPIALAALKAKTTITMDGKPVPFEASYLPANAQMAGYPSATAPAGKDFDLAPDLGLHMDVLEGQPPSDSTKPEAWRRSFALRPMRPWTPGAKVVVRIAASLASEAGPLPAGRESLKKLAVAELPRLKKATCAFAADSMVLEFATPLARGQVKTIESSPSLTWWRDNQIPTKVVSKPTKVGRYAIVLPAGLTDLFGQKLEQRTDINVDCSRVQPGLNLALPNGTTLDARQPIVGIEARGVKRARLRAVVLDAAAIARMDAIKDQSDISKWTQDPKAIWETQIELNPTGPSQWASVSFDLRRVLGQQRRPVVVRIDPVDPTKLPARKNENRWAIYQVTDLAILPVEVHGGVQLRILRLRDGAPAARVQAALACGGAVAPIGVSDAQGMVRMNFQAAPKTMDGCGSDRDEFARLAFATSDGSELSYLVSHAFWSISLPASDDHPKDKSKKLLQPNESLMGTVVTDRNVYTPGEKVHFAAWGRIVGGDGEPRAIPETAPVEMSLADCGAKDPTWTRVAQANGKYWGQATLPRLPGTYCLTLRGPDRRELAERRVEVQDLRVPEMTVDVSGPSDYLPGEPIRFKVDARYQFGAPVPISQIRYQVECLASEAVFGGYSGSMSNFFWYFGSENWRKIHGAPTKVWQGTLSPKSKLDQATLVLPELGADQRVSPSLPNICRLELAVGDASLRESATETHFKLHPSAAYIGIRLVPAPSEHNPPKQAFLCAVSPSHQTLALPRVKVTLRRIGQSELLGDWVVATRASGDDVEIALPALDPGTYEMEAHSERPSAGPLGATAVTRARFVVEDPPDDGEWVGEKMGMREHRDLTFTVEGEARPGQAVRVSVAGPKTAAGASGLLVVANRNPIVLPITLSQGTAQATVTLPVTEAWPEETTVSALVLAAQGPGPTLAALAGRTEIKVSRDSSRIPVKVTVPERAHPGETIAIAVQASGQAATSGAGRVAIWVTDDALVRLDSSGSSDLVADFIPPRYSYLGAGWSRKPSPPYQSIAEDPFLPFGGFDPPGPRRLRVVYYDSLIRGEVPVVNQARVRRNFEATPFFVGDAPLDRMGRAQVRFRAPDNATTFQVTAIASGPLPGTTIPGQFGTGTGKVTVTQSLLARPLVPRHLRPGDRSEILVVVDNLSNLAGLLHTELRAGAAAGAAPLVILSPPASAALAAHGQSTARFAVRADGPGTVKLLTRARLQPDRGSPLLDAVEIPVEILPEPSLLDNVAAHGVLDQQAAATVPLTLPAMRTVGAIKIQLSTSLGGALEPALRALLEYPYGCLEQTTSRLVPWLVSPELTAHILGGKEEAEKARDQALTRLLQMKLEGVSEGFTQWPGFKTRSPFTSYAGLILLLLDEAKIPVRQGDWSLAVNRGDDEARKKTGGHDTTDAMALFADAKRYGAEAKLARLWRKRRGLATEAQAFLALAMHRANARDPRLPGLAAALSAGIVERFGAGHFRNRQSALDEVFPLSQNTADAAVLWALATLTPHDAKLPGLAKGLLLARAHEAWNNTFENALALLALHRFDPGSAPATRTRVEVTVAGQRHDVELSGTSPATLSIPLSALPAGKLEQSVALSRRGAGRIFYTVAMSYQPDDAERASHERGLMLTRGLRRAGGALPEPWALKAGEIVALDIRISATDSVRDLAIDVPIPPGLEPIHIDLKGEAGALPVAGDSGWWVAHQELLADRCRFYAVDLPAGEHSHTVFLRALVPGRYQVPAAHAEAMYRPEINARTAATTADIK